MGRYDAILHMDKPVDRKHKPMSIHNRAAQFAPFDALTGFSGKIYETARLTDSKIELTEEEQSFLDARLRILIAESDTHPSVTLTYFVADEKKDGGAYQTVSARIKKFFPSNDRLQLEDDTVVAFGDILSVDSPLLASLDPIC